MVFGVAALVVGACGGGAPSSSSSDVQTTLSDFAIVVSDTSLPAGANRLAITNAGATLHELEVFTLPAGVDAANIPVSNNVADTDSVGMTVVDEVEDIAPGTGTSLNVSLQPGQYAFICNLPTHYGLGMHAVVTVE